MKNKASFFNLAQFISYRIILAAIILIFTLFSSVAAFTVGKWYINKALSRQYIFDYMNTVEENLSNSFSSLIYKINTLSIYFTTNLNLYSTLQNKDFDSATKNLKLDEIIDPFWKNKNIVQGVSIIDQDGVIYNFTPDASLKEFCTPDCINEIGDSPLYFFDTCVKGDNNNYYIMTGKKLYNYYTGNFSGYLIMYINENEFSGLYKNYTFADTSFYIILNNNILSHSDKKMINSKTDIINDLFDPSSKSFSVNDYIISKREINLNNIITGLEVVSVTDFSKIASILGIANLYLIIIFIVAIVISISFAFIISWRLLYEIDILRKNIVELETSPSDYVPKFKLNEIKTLENDFVSMTNRINSLIDNIKEEKEKQKQAELSSLQAQINPHFIYNTLDSIAWMSLMEDNQKVYNTICSLSDFFRVSLSKGKSLITIREELEHVKSYIAIEKVRFPNKFNVEFNIDENILSCKIVKIILQPLVENAIKHGFEKISTGGIITISGGFYDPQKHFIVLSVKDNGCGTTVVPFNKTTENEMFSSGYGLVNIKERLKLTYGDDCQLRFDSVPGVGTTVTIIIKSDF